MDTIVVALIALAGTIITGVITARATQDKVTQELQTQNAVQNHKIDQLALDINTVKHELTDKIESNRELSEIKIDQLVKKQDEMAQSIKEHNNYAKSMPVIEEKVKVINNRLDDLESCQKTCIKKL